MFGILQRAIWLALVSLVTISTGFPLLDVTKYATTFEAPYYSFPSFTKRQADANHLFKRVESNEILGVLQDSSKTTYVGTGDWAYRSFEDGAFPSYIGTASLDGCTAVAICNTKGCLLAHFLPDVEDSPTYSWRDGLKKAFDDNEAKLDGASAIVVAANKFEEDGLEFQWQVDSIVSWLKDEKGLESQQASYSMATMMDEDYEETEQDDVEQEDLPLGTVLVEAKDDSSAPVLYVEGVAQG